MEVTAGPQGQALVPGRRWGGGGKGVSLENRSLPVASEVVLSQEGESLGCQTGADMLILVTQIVCIDRSPGRPRGALW